MNINQVETSGVHYQLTNDIDFSGYDTDADASNGNWNPLGYLMSQGMYYFKGSFDGQGHKISNIKILRPGENYIGFFGATDGGVIKGLGLENILVKGNLYVGGFVGEIANNTVIEKSYTTGEVVGGQRVGGFAGEMWKGGKISESYSTANVSGIEGLTHQRFGGFVGFLDKGTIQDCYATGNVTGGSYPGGFIGYISNFVTLKNSYSTGKVICNGTCGGGFSGASAVILNTKNYFDTETSGWSSSPIATGLTTAQMTGESAKTNMAGFDFNNVWKTTNSYPKLQWQSEDATGSIDKVKDVTVNGTVQTMVADVVIPAVSPDLVINPNLEEGYVAPEFSVSNDSVSPIKLELKTFEQVTNTFNDVLPSKYSSWEGLNKRQSQDIALGLVAKEGDGWQSLTTPTSYVANHINREVGIIKPNSSVDFSFDVKHGTSFSEAKKVQYKMVFVFDLMN